MILYVLTNIFLSVFNNEKYQSCCISIFLNKIPPFKFEKKTNLHYLTTLSNHGNCFEDGPSTGIYQNCRIKFSDWRGDLEKIIR